MSREPSDVALQAKADISRHEAECAIRWAQAQKTMDDIREQLRALTGRWWAAATVAIGVLGSAVVFLFGKQTGLW